MPAGRPTDYRPEFVEQAAKLCLLGAKDEELAAFFAIKPNEEDFMLFWLHLHRQDRRGLSEHRRSLRAKRRARTLCPSSKLLNSTRARMWSALKGKSKGALFSKLPYSLNELFLHLESRFAQGMTWENYGKWHVDHIRPCATFDLCDSNQFRECWALSNLQPLWASENVRKGAKYGRS